MKRDEEWENKETEVEGKKEGKGGGMVDEGDAK